MRMTMRMGARMGWVLSFIGVGGLGLSASAVAEDVKASLERDYTENFVTVKDPHSFDRELTYELPRPFVPLTREDAVVNELFLRSKTLSESEVRRTARVIVEEAEALGQDPLLFLAVIHI